MKSGSSLLFRVQEVVLFGSAAVRMAVDDPKLLIAKALEKLRISQPRIYHFFFKGFDDARLRISSSLVQSLWHEGEFEKLRRLKESRVLTRPERKKIRLASEKLTLLREPIPNSAQVHSGETNARILMFVSNSLPYTQSGYTVRTHETARALLARGCEVLACTRLAYPAIIGSLAGKRINSIDRVNYVRLMPWRYPKTLAERQHVASSMLAEVALKFEANVLHTTTDYNNALVASAAAASAGIPWIYEVRGELESTWLSRFPMEEQEARRKSDFYTLARAQEEAAMRAASKVIVLSEVSKRSLENRGIEPNKIRVIPNAVAGSLVGLKHDRKQLRSELGVVGEVVVGTVTSVVEYEGLDTLLRAAAITPGITLLIVGDGSDRPRLEEMAEELGIAGRTIFVGKQPHSEIWKWYGCLDAFVVPRRNTDVCRKVTPIKPLIAQALGIPVIASDLPALREITGGIGAYFEPEDVEALAVKLRAVVAGAPRSTEAIDWAFSHTWEANAARLKAVYAEVLNGKDLGEAGTR